MKAMGLWLLWVGCVGLAGSLAGRPLGLQLWGLHPPLTPGLAEMGLLTLILPFLLWARIEWRAVWLGLASIGTAIAGAAIANWTTDHGRLYWGDLDADQLGVILALSSGIWLWHSRFEILAAPSLFGLAVTGCRGATIGLMVAALLARQWRVPIGLLSIGIWVWRIAGNSIVEADSERASLASNALQAVWEKPWGWGHAGWVQVTLASHPGDVSIALNDRAHLLLLDWALLGGLFGLAVMACLLALAWKRAGEADRGLLALWLGSAFFLFPTSWMDLILILLIGSVFGKEVRLTLVRAEQEVGREKASEIDERWSWEGKQVGCSDG